MKLQKRIPYYIMLSLLILNVLALSMPPVTGQETLAEEEVSPFLVGQVASDGTLILTYIAETKEAITYIPEQLGSEDKPLVQETFYVWIFSSATPSATFLFNYTVYEAETVTEYIVDPQNPDELIERNVTQYSKVVYNDTFRIMTGERADFRGQIKFELTEDLQSNITRCFEIQYLNAKIRFFYYTHPGLQEYTLPGWAVNMLSIGYILITWLLCNLIAVGGAKRFLDRVIYAAPPPGWMTWATAFSVTIAFSALANLAQYPSISLLWLNIQMIPAVLVLIPLFIHSIWHTSTSFNSKAIERYTYIIYSQTDPHIHPTVELQSLLLYEREHYGESYYCWLPEPKGGGVLGMVKRFFGFDIKIRGDPAAGYTYDPGTARDMRIIPVERDQFSIDLGSYMIEQHNVQGLRYLVWFGIALGLIGVFSYLMQPIFALFMLLCAVGVFGIVALQYTRIVRGETKAAEIHIEPTKHDPLRIWFDTNVRKEQAAKLEEVYNDYIELQAKYETGVFKQGQKYVQTYQNLLAAALGIHPPMMKPENLAETLIATNQPLDRVKAPDAFKKRIKKHMEEIEETDESDNETGKTQSSSGGEET